jgi:hypothetical protein
MLYHVASLDVATLDTESGGFVPGYWLANHPSARVETRIGARPARSETTRNEYLSAKPVRTS